MNDITILDGGMGKELRRIGAPFRQPEWSSLALIEAPEMVVQAHRNFINAGARVITTNNYAVVPYHHSTEFFVERGSKLIDLAGTLAREAADSAQWPVRVAGSMPPLFGSYDPASVDAARSAPIYRDIAGALEPYVDLWMGETLSTLVEVELITAAIAATDSDRPIWVSFSVPDEWNPQHGIALRSGENMAAIAAEIGRHPDIEAALINCSLPEQTGPALAELRRELDTRGLDHVRTGGYANAFPDRADDYRANEVIFERREDLTATRYADFVAQWVDDGATIVGGCCNMYPEHIAELSSRFDCA